MENSMIVQLYTPFHIHSFAAERDEEPNTCATSKNFLNVQLQQSEKERNKQKRKS